MYPQAELDRLARRKRELLCSIRARREALAGHVEPVLRPIIWADWAYTQWRGIVPAIKNAVARSTPVVTPASSSITDEWVGGLFRWAPMAVNIFRSLF